MDSNYYENILNDYDLDLSVNHSFIDEANIVLSGETLVFGNITLWELAGIFLISSVILSKNFVTFFTFLTCQIKTS